MEYLFYYFWFFVDGVWIGIVGGCLLLWCDWCEYYWFLGGKFVGCGVDLGIGCWKWGYMLDWYFFLMVKGGVCLLVLKLFGLFYLDVLEKWGFCG